MDSLEPSVLWWLCWGAMVKCLVSSNTAQEPMLELLLTAQLTKCDGVFFNPKELVFWNGDSSTHASQSKAEMEPRKKWENITFFSIARPQHMLPSWRQRKNSWVAWLIVDVYWDLFDRFLAVKLRVKLKADFCAGENSIRNRPDKSWLDWNFHAQIRATRPCPGN